MTRKKISAKFTRKNTAKKNLSRLILGIFVIVSALSFLFFETKRVSSLILSKLPLPQEVATTYLPGPLQLPTYIASVLGAQTIDPSDIVTYVNKERAIRGVQPLRISPTLMQAAKMRADVILKHQNFSHQDPYENIELVTVLPKVGYHYKYASENIGMGGQSGEDFVQGFMHSPSHRDNLLNSYLSDTGTAIVTGPYQQYYVNIAVQLFAIPGGKNEYLGYTSEDIVEYKKSLSQINAKLNPIVWSLRKLLKYESSTEVEYEKLLRKQEILATILTLVQNEEPLTNEHVLLLREYNASLN